MADTLGVLIDAETQANNQELRALGVQIGKLYTDHGLPLDMALERLPYTKMQKVSVLDGALGWLIEHRRNSGANDKAIERQRHANRRIMETFISMGETGVY